MKYHAHNHALRIKESHDGIDFFYAGKQEARKMVDFLQTVVPCRYVKLEWGMDVLHYIPFQCYAISQPKLVRIEKN